MKNEVMSQSISGMKMSRRHFYQWLLYQWLHAMDWITIAR